MIAPVASYYMVSYLGPHCVVASPRQQQPERPAHAPQEPKPLLVGPFTPSHPSPGITDQKLPQVHITSKMASITRKKNGRGWYTSCTSRTASSVGPPESARGTPLTRKQVPLRAPPANYCVRSGGEVEIPPILNGAPLFENVVSAKTTLSELLQQRL